MSWAAAPPSQGQTAAAVDDWQFFLGGVEGQSGQYYVATTRAGRVSLSLAVAPSANGVAEVHTVLSEPRWTHTGRPLAYRLDFDEFAWGAWVMRGWGDGITFEARWRSLETFPEFMEDVAGREWTTLYADAGALLANFSLEGSRSATVASNNASNASASPSAGRPSGPTVSRA